jgi:quercetin dioxygenase-like cupin family protein
MKNIHHTLQKISDLTATIETNYPELFVSLENNPPLLDHPGLPADQKSLGPYLETFKLILEEQLEQHKNRKTQRLKNLANEINYNEEKFRSKVIAEKGVQKTLLFAFTKGQGLKAGPDPEDTILIMLEGYSTFTFGNSEQQLQPGEIFRIPAHTIYSLQAVTYFKMILLK